MIKTNKMEGLMDALAGVLAQVPEDPMAPEWIGIQSRGMKQWITLQVAQKLGICANLTFLFPRQIIERIFSDSRPLLNQDVLTWSIMEGILQNFDTPCFSSLKNYIQSDRAGRRLFQLAVKIARVLDDYQIYRPDMLQNWEKKEKSALFTDPIMEWQSILWNHLAHGLPPMADPMAQFLNQAHFGQGLDKASHLPGRICLFGISALPMSFMHIFGALAQKMDIYLFLLTPSNQFFFDIVSQRHMEKMALNPAPSLDPGAGFHEIANPLLASLGQSGRDFHGSLEGFDYHEPFEDLFEDPLDRSQTMLAYLQSDILNLVHREAGKDHGPVAVDPTDLSITLHACHSPMREAQVLKDLLMDALENDPSLALHEIIVMMPDIEAYAPYIEAVFSSEHALAFSISDRRKKSESQTLEAFLKILGLKDSRLEQSRVLDLLLCPAISTRFEIGHEDLGTIEAALKAAGVLWARDGVHRKELTGTGFEENTWRFGFQRLFMGYALAQGQENLAQGILACEVFEGLDSEILGKTAHFGHTLFTRLQALETPKTIAGWGQCFKTLVLSLMENIPGNEADMTLLFQTIDDFVQDGESAGFAREIDFQVARETIERKLDKTIAQGNFLAGSLTFCNLMPMRSIPFKLVVLMGMDEAGFPRKSKAPGFDLIQKYPRKGDKQEREEDRYLFLESLLSARDRLIITYTGMSIQDNSLVPISSVVEELKEVMAKSFEFPEEFVFSFTHPLHPFNPIYFDPSPSPAFQGFFSFSLNQCQLAISQAARGQKEDDPDHKVFFPPGFCLEPKIKAEEKTRTLADLVRFFRNPVQDFLSQGLNLSYPRMEEQALDREAFQLSGLSRYSLGSYYMDQGRKTDLYPLCRAGGLLPFGQKGRAEWDRVKELADPIAELAGTLIKGQSLPPLGVDTQVLGIGISGNIPDLYQKGRFLTGFGRLTPARLLTHWIYHLFLNAFGQDRLQDLEVCRTWMVGQDPKGKEPAVIYSFGPVAHAFDHIQDLISLFQKGQTQPLAFFCDTCFYLAESLSRKEYEVTPETLAQALHHSRRYWFDRYNRTGEGMNRYAALVFKQRDPLESPETLLASGLVDHALAVYKPLLAFLENKTSP